MTGQFTIAQLQKHQAARLSRRIAVDQKVCGWDGRHPGLTVWNLLNCTRIEYVQYIQQASQENFRFYYLAVICINTGGQNRYGLVSAFMINPPELPINDQARNDAHIAVWRTKNKPSTMLSSNVQSNDLLTDCTAWRF